MYSIMEIVGVSKHFGQVKAVNDISFTLPQGVCFGLLGPNGAGKTTTIEMMEGILEPTLGEILFRGKPIDRHFRQKVGIQFQSTSLPEFISVKETLELFGSFYPNPRLMEEVIELCSLQDILDRDNRKLSGGQRQRMLLGIAIIPRPELVFLDEPTTGLDPQSRRNFWELIRRIRKEGTTVLLTTHYMDEAQVLCDLIGIMDNGKILDIDTPQNLLNKHFTGVLLSFPCQESQALVDDQHQLGSIDDSIAGFSAGSIASSTAGSMDQELDDNSETIIPKPQPPIAGAVLNGDRWEIQTSDIDGTIKRLLDAQVDLDGMSIHKPNLEDLFIHLTGSSLRT
jgi:ABC-2 type transport system ATP-binding protein